MNEKRDASEIIHHKALREKDSGFGQIHPSSFEGLTKALEGESIELDVFLLRDGSVGVGHEKDIKTNLSVLENMDLDQFQNFNQPTIDSIPKSGVKMPLLKEALELAYDRGVNLFVELKANSSEKLRLLADEILKILSYQVNQGVFKENPDFIKNLSFFSLSIDGIDYFAKKAKDLGVKIFFTWPSSKVRAADTEIQKTVIDYADTITDTSDWTEQGIKLAKKMGFYAVGLHFSKLLENEQYTTLAHSLGLQVITWTVNNEEEIKKLEEQRVDGIFTEIR
jgi:glycerophosphoryl diester phosphodiesterase